MGWCITATSFLPIPLFALYNVYKAKADGLWNVSMANTLKSSENVALTYNLYSILIIFYVVLIFRNFWSRSNRQFNIAPAAARSDWMKILRHMQTHDSHWLESVNRRIWRWNRSFKCTKTWLIFRINYTTAMNRISKMKYLPSKTNDVGCWIKYSTRK